MDVEVLKVDLPKHLFDELKAIAKLAGLSTEAVSRVALATEARRWERKREAQESSSAT